ncbi:lycopene cyclase family protein [Rhodococcus tukisamuensis]|uniref:Lycopene beta-cyclase n=1 Tax=Rhodococcus tukisamuensis TaxID=168276 RepID=A0A1G7EFP0_9NOCA|nr:lycopene cyclase family protein [Rhodococcus tukisamuensis]SDE62464.1 lycopene beta-cyclase [Rhodococcus tukisamuensis]
MRADLAVVGLGPAGRALAHRAAAAGLDVVAVDPRPARPWTPTYAAWLDELPAWLGPSVVRARVDRPRVWARREHTLDRPYCVLDNEALRAALDLGGTRVLAGTAATVTAHAVTLRDGTEVRATRVLDARGLHPGPALAEQTAYGVVVDAAAAAPALGGGPAWFMDWRPDNGAAADAPPSFLYAVPLGTDRVLLEETCLVGRPGLSLGVLRGRLETRLRSRGVEPPVDAVQERVRFPVQAPRPGRPGQGAPGFGARGGLVHPGTGYSVAASLGAADVVARAVAEGRDPDAALWPARARAVRALREVGLRSLLRLEPEATAGFFEAFFALDPGRQHAYLSGRDDPLAVAGAMWALFRRAPGPVRRTLVRSVRKD